MNQKVKSCDSCNFAEKTNSLTYPVKCTISKPIPMMVHEYCVNWFAYVGCASHSDFQSERDVKELFRKEIAKWKDEDPLFMAYVYGQEASKKEERETCPQNKIWQHCPAVGQIRKNERDLDDYCKIGLYWYVHGDEESEDVGLCRGKSCNYCGRYNEELRQQAGEP
jgi:dihydroxyacetone kinase-like predicted kinase